MMDERYGRRSFVLIVLAIAMWVPLHPAALRAQAPAGGQRFEGTLTVRWGDPRFPGTAGAVRYLLEPRDGRYVPVEPTQDANDLLRLQGHEVVVNGRMASRAAVAGRGGDAAIVADSIADDPRATSAASLDAAPVSGTRKVLF